MKRIMLQLIKSSFLGFILYIVCFYSSYSQIILELEKKDIKVSVSTKSGIKAPELKREIKNGGVLYCYPVDFSDNVVLSGQKTWSSAATLTNLRNGLCPDLLEKFIFFSKYEKMNLKGKNCNGKIGVLISSTRNEVYYSRTERYNYLVYINILITNKYVLDIEVTMYNYSKIPTQRMFSFVDGIIRSLTLNTYR